ncbi:ParB N-terminal domain-containing protein [bacterium]|nr:ParB N-terminal domain-containing protein [bacterium]
MRVISQQFEIVPIDSVRPHPQNPRSGDTSIIRDSIEINGWYGAIIVQESTGYILAGNHRYKAALQNGATMIPSIRVAVTDDEATRIMLADNRTSDVATYDDKLLSSILEELSIAPLGLRGTGFDESALEELLEELSDGRAEEVATDQLNELEDRFEIVVSCPSEETQRSLLERLMDEGFTCRALIS